MSGKDSDKDTKKDKKDEPTKQSWKKKVEDLPGGAKDKAVKGGGGPTNIDQDKNDMHSRA